MTLWNRLRLAYMALFGNTKALATMVPTWREGQPTYPEANFESMVRHGWRRNELIFACVSKTANTASQVTLRVYSRRDNKPLDEHPLAALIAQPNPYMNEFDFWAAVIIYQRFAGRAIFEKERSRAGQVVRLWPLRPDWVRPVPSSENVIAYYEYAPPGLDKVRLDPADVLDFKLFDPLNLYHGFPPVAVAARVGDVDSAMTDYLKLFYQHGGMPPGLLKTTQKLGQAERERIRAQWSETYGGYRSWLAPAVLDSDASFQQVGFDFRQMGTEVLDARNEARICMVLDVPPILVGAKVGLDRSTFSNYREARRAWWEDSLTALYKNLSDTVDGQLVPEFGDDIYAEWDFSQVPALQEAIGERWQRATEALRAGFITVNDARHLVGLPEDPRGDVYLRPIGTVEVPATKTTKALAVEPLAVPSANGHGKSVKAEEAPDDEEDRRALEEETRAALVKFFGGQLERIEMSLEEELLGAAV